MQCHCQTDTHGHWFGNETSAHPKSVDGCTLLLYFAHTLVHCPAILPSHPSNNIRVGRLLMYVGMTWTCNIFYAILKQKLYNFTINELKAYLNGQTSSLSAFVISKTHIVAQNPCRRQLNAKVVKGPFFIFFLSFL